VGYHVQILRRRSGRRDPITRSEIEALALSDSGLRIEPPSPKSADLNLVISRSGSEVASLALQNGKLWAKNPEESAIQVMIDLAKQLGARVRGDEFETYRSIDETYFDPEDAEERRRTQQQGEELVLSSSRQQRWIRLAIIGFFLVLGLIGLFVGKMFEK
jgi:hypothetical protein